MKNTRECKLLYMVKDRMSKEAQLVRDRKKYLTILGKPFLKTYLDNYEAHGAAAVELLASAQDWATHGRAIKAILPHLGGDGRKKALAALVERFDTSDVAAEESRQGHEKHLGVLNTSFVDFYLHAYDELGAAAIELIAGPADMAAHGDSLKAIFPYLEGDARKEALAALVEAFETRDNLRKSLATARRVRVRKEHLEILEKPPLKTYMECADLDRPQAIALLFDYIDWATRGRAIKAAVPYVEDADQKQALVALVASFEGDFEGE